MWVHLFKNVRKCKQVYSNRKQVSGTWRGGGEQGRGKRQGARTFSGVMDMFTILNVVIIVLVYTWAKLYQIEYFKYVQSIDVNYTSIKLSKQR